MRILGLLVVAGLIVLSASSASGSPSMVAIGATPRVPANAKALGARVGVDIGVRRARAQAAG
jgi:hypothetical protein